MKKTQKRAFILSECKSPYIAQAIFILKDGVSEYEHSVLADAERIVASYMGGSKYPKDKDKSGKYICLSFILASLLSLASLAILLIK